MSKYLKIDLKIKFPLFLIKKTNIGILKIIKNRFGIKKTKLEKEI